GRRGVAGVGVWTSRPARLLGQLAADRGTVGIVGFHGRVRTLRVVAVARKLPGLGLARPVLPERSVDRDRSGNSRPPDGNPSVCGAESKRSGGPVAGPRNAALPLA